MDLLSFTMGNPIMVDVADSRDPVPGAAGGASTGRRGGREAAGSAPAPLTQPLGVVGNPHTLCPNRGVAQRPPVPPKPSESIEKQGFGTLRHTFWQIEISAGLPMADPIVVVKVCNGVRLGSNWKFRSRISTLSHSFNCNVEPRRSLGVWLGGK